MPWVRLASGDSASSDGASVEPVIRYRVWGVPQSQIINDPRTVFSGGTTGEPLPGYGDIHPDYAGVNFPPRLDRYEVQVDGRGEVVGASGRYSKDNRFRLPDPPILPDRFLGFGGSATPLEYEIPIARREYAEGSDVDSRPIGFWEVDAFIHTAHAARRTASVRIESTALTHQARYLIDRAVGHIHLLSFADGGGLWQQKFQFAGWSHNSVGTDKVDIRYEWVSDPGTELLDFRALFQLLGPEEQAPTGVTIQFPRFDPPISDTGAIPAGGFLYNVGSAGQIGFLRPPFHALLYVPPSDHRNFGTYKVQMMAVERLSEWQSFPGIL